MTDINTPDAILEESVAVLDLQAHKGDVVHYRINPEDVLFVDAYPHSTCISTTAWLEMGRPDQITVAVTPGDTLNSPKRRTQTAPAIVRFLGKAVGVSVVALISGAVVAACVAGLVGIGRLLGAFLAA